MSMQTETTKIARSKQIHQSEPVNPLQLLAQMCAKEPTKTFAQIIPEWTGHILANEKWNRQGLTELGGIYWKEIHPRGRSRHTTKEMRRERIVARTQNIKEIKSRIEHVVLMNLPLPNGGIVRNATGAHLAKAGGVFYKWAKLLKPDQIVGETLTEKQLRAAR